MGNSNQDPDPLRMPRVQGIACNISMRAIQMQEIEVIKLMILNSQQFQMKWPFILFSLRIHQTNDLSGFEILVCVDVYSSKFMFTSFSLLFAVDLELGSKCTGRNPPTSKSKKSLPGKKNSCRNGSGRLDVDEAIALAKASGIKQLPFSPISAHRNYFRDFLLSLQKDEFCKIKLYPIQTRRNHSRGYVHGHEFQSIFSFDSDHKSSSLTIPIPFFFQKT